MDRNELLQAIQRRRQDGTGTRNRSPHRLNPAPGGGVKPQMRTRRHRPKKTGGNREEPSHQHRNNSTNPRQHIPRSNTEMQILGLPPRDADLPRVVHLPTSDLPHEQAFLERVTAEDDGTAFGHQNLVLNLDTLHPADLPNIAFNTDHHARLQFAVVEFGMV